jgi:NAD(P)-dependent dehydrogenase (short-subunit alcohol dehydrogenase family)
MVNQLDNQRVVVLGGSSGIGFGVAKKLIETSKASVIIASSSATKVDKAVSALSILPGAQGRITGYPLNLDISTSDEPLTQFFAKIGEFNHLVYCAGDSLALFPLEEFTKPKAEKMFGIRYFSLLTSIRIALPYMPKSAASSIILTSGTVTFRPMKGWAAAGSGVGSAVEGLTRGLAVDLAPIRVNCVAPGAVPETDLWAALGEEERATMMEYFKNKSLTGELGRVEDIAEAYTYLLKGRFTDGQTLILDGGEYLC